VYRYKATLISISLAIFLLLAILFLSKSATAKLSADSQKFAQVGQVDGNEPTFLTGPNQGQPLDIALDYISDNKGQFDLNASDISDILVTDQYTSKHTGVTHIYLRQRYEGIEIINANININIARDGSVVNLGNSFVADLESAVNDTTPKLYPTDAVELAAESVGLSLSSPLVSEKQPAGEEQGLLFSGGGVSQEPIPVTLVYESQEAGVYLAWNVEIYEKSGDHWWSMRVDAIDGSILSQFDRVVHDALSIPAAAPWWSIPPSKPLPLTAGTMTMASKGPITRRPRATMFMPTQT
jgi:Zn-dependent metalloprotease